MTTRRQFCQSTAGVAAGTIAGTVAGALLPVGAAAAPLSNAPLTNAEAPMETYRTHAPLHDLQRRFLDTRMGM
ncbi:hypothetical protein EON79_17935, partial [bacterium]